MNGWCACACAQCSGGVAGSEYHPLGCPVLAYSATSQRHECHIMVGHQHRAINEIWWQCSFLNSATTSSRCAKWSSTHQTRPSTSCSSRTTSSWPPSSRLTSMSVMSCASCSVVWMPSSQHHQYASTTLALTLLLAHRLTRHIAEHKSAPSINTRSRHAATRRVRRSIIVLWYARAHPPYHS